MRRQTSDALPSRLLSAFFRFNRTPWHNAPADGLSFAETSVLEHIHRANRRGRILRVSDLSAMLRVSSPTVTQHINYLESLGFVERVQSKEDKRAVNLSLTDKGKEALSSHWVELEHNFAELINEIGEEEAETMIESLSKAHTFFMEKAKQYEAPEDMF